MQIKKFNDGYIIRLEKGEEIITTLTKFLNDNNIKVGYFTGLGAISKAELKIFHQVRKEYDTRSYEQDFELVSLTGNITTLENKSYIHAHCVISDKDMNCFGGHLESAIVGPTVEISLVAFEGEIPRKFDEDIGLNLMDIKI